MWRSSRLHARHCCNNSTIHHALTIVTASPLALRLRRTSHFRNDAPSIMPCQPDRCHPLPCVAGLLDVRHGQQPMDRRHLLRHAALPAQGRDAVLNGGRRQGAAAPSNERCWALVLLSLRCGGFGCFCSVACPCGVAAHSVRGAQQRLRSTAAPAAQVYFSGHTSKELSNDGRPRQQTQRQSATLALALTRCLPSPRRYSCLAATTARSC